MYLSEPLLEALIINDVTPLCQVDGFLALYWNVKYKHRVTFSRAAKTIAVSKVSMFTTASLVTKLDPEATRCKRTDSIACQVKIFGTA